MRQKNPETFWQYVNLRTKKTSGIADLETPQQTLTSNDAKKAEILTNHSPVSSTKKSLITYHKHQT